MEIGRRAHVCRLLVDLERLQQRRRPQPQLVVANLEGRADRNHHGAPARQHHLQRPAERSVGPTHDGNLVALVLRGAGGQGRRGEHAIGMRNPVPTMTQVPHAKALGCGRRRGVTGVEHDRQASLGHLLQEPIEHVERQHVLQLAAMLHQILRAQNQIIVLCIAMP